MCVPARECWIRTFLFRIVKYLMYALLSFYKYLIPCYFSCLISVSPSPLNGEGKSYSQLILPHSVSFIFSTICLFSSYSSGKICGSLKKSCEKKSRLEFLDFGSDFQDKNRLTHFCGLCLVRIDFLTGWRQNECWINFTHNIE